MASYLTNHDAGARPHEVRFDELWRHYELSRFIYPAKRKLLEPRLGELRRVWSALLGAPASLFQLHYGLHEAALASSTGAFRDTPSCYVIQHASSLSRPDLLIESLISLTTGISATNAEHVCMFFRPSNRWPARLREVLAARLPERLHATLEFDYLLGTPLPAPLPDQVHELEGELPEAARHIVLDSWGVLKASTLGFLTDQHAWEGMESDYARAALCRRRHVLAWCVDGQPAALAAVHTGSFPVNMSFLCNRVELALPESLENRAQAITALLGAAGSLFARAGCPHYTALLKPADTPHAVRAGLVSEGRSYSQFIWSREGSRGFASTAIALSAWYALATNWKLQTPSRPQP